MKTSIYITLIAVATLASCGGGSQQNQTATTETSTQQSATTDNQQPATPKSKKTEQFLTQDLRMHNLFGKVKTFKTMITDCGADQKPLNPSNKPYEDYFSLEYDADGHFKGYITEMAINVSGVKKRDGDKIIEASSPIEDFAGVELSGIWTYNADNLVQKYVAKGLESEAEYEYTYNDDCELTQTLERSSAEGQSYKVKTTYQILKRDEQGNWTERFATIESETADWDSDKQDFGAYQKDETRYELQQRTITYY
jgi:hypothetical protein